MATESIADLATERQAFERNLEAWRPNHAGEFVLIKGANVIGFYKSLDEATSEGFKRFKLDDFFVARIDPPGVVHVTFLGQPVHVG